MSRRRTYGGNEGLHLGEIKTYLVFSDLSDSSDCIQYSSDGITFSKGAGMIYRNSNMYPWITILRENEKDVLILINIETGFVYPKVYVYAKVIDNEIIQNLKSSSYCILDGSSSSYAPEAIMSSSDLIGQYSYPNTMEELIPHAVSSYTSYDDEGNYLCTVSLVNENEDRLLFMSIRYNSGSDSREVSLNPWNNLSLDTNNIPSTGYIDYRSVRDSSGEFNSICISSNASYTSKSITIRCQVSSSNSVDTLISLESSGYYNYTSRSFSLGYDYNDVFLVVSSSLITSTGAADNQVRLLRINDQFKFDLVKELEVEADNSILSSCCGYRLFYRPYDLYNDSMVTTSELVKNYDLMDNGFMSISDDVYKLSTSHHFRNLSSGNVFNGFNNGKYFAKGNSNCKFTSDGGLTYNPTNIALSNPDIITGSRL